MRSKKIIYNIITNLVLQIVTIIYGFIVPKIIISKYGSDVNGLISSITQFLAYISLLESGFGPVVKSILYKPIAKKDNKEISNILKSSEIFFRNISKIFIIYIIILCIFYPIIINNQFDTIFTLSLIIIISISTFFEYYFGMTYKLFLQSDQKTYVISVIQIVTYLLSIAIIVICSLFNVSIQFLKILSSFAFLLRPIIQNIYVKKKYNINLNGDSTYKIKNKWDGLSQHIASVIHSNTDITILTFFSKMSEISVYSVYNLVVSGIKKMVQVFSSGIDSTFGDMLTKGEKENLNKKFNMYELIFLSIVTIIFSCTLVLITPFVTIYTKNIHDANYNRFLFGILIVISEYICMIRLPYINLTFAAGHFKETSKGAWIECILNLSISLALVSKFGLIGTTIGTIVAMGVRTFEFLIHTNSKILNRSIFISLKKIFILIFETVIILIISFNMPLLEFTNYLNFIINSIIILFISVLIVIINILIFYKKEFLELILIIKKSLMRRGVFNDKKND